MTTITIGSAVAVDKKYEAMDYCVHDDFAYCIGPLVNNRYYDVYAHRLRSSRTIWAWYIEQTNLNDDTLRQVASGFVENIDLVITGANDALEEIVAGRTATEVFRHV
ncbi:hypothetical protein [Rhizobium laguerreae]|uniref:hypothetical protein n=1 Tax=Rhizobium laguerreae TaxID=1076926 RepID=UPI001A8EB598|nr:hypothetical protein [Rhizobium laguerreae]MBN9981862.1 hypothetical protein [Rhizobium laguerreae]